MGGQELLEASGLGIGGVTLAWDVDFSLFRRLENHCRIDSPVRPNPFTQISICGFLTLWATFWK